MIAVGFRQSESAAAKSSPVEHDSALSGADSTVYIADCLLWMNSISLQVEVSTGHKIQGVALPDSLTQDKLHVWGTRKLLQHGSSHNMQQTSDFSCNKVNKAKNPKGSSAPVTVLSKLLH